MDGPNHEQNFQRGILNAEANLSEIVRYLRFYQPAEASNEGEKRKYQDFLLQYAPKLCKLHCKEAFFEFVSQITDVEKRDALLVEMTELVNAELPAPAELPVEDGVPITEASEVSTEAPAAVDAPKKRGRKKKSE